MEGAGQRCGITLEAFGDLKRENETLGFVSYVLHSRLALVSNYCFHWLVILRMRKNVASAALHISAGIVGILSGAAQCLSAKVQPGMPGWKVSS